MKQNKNNPKHYEMFIGIIDDIYTKNKESEISMRVDAILHPSYANLRLSDSILTPGTTVIIRSKFLNIENLSEGDRLLVAGELEKQKSGVTTFYIANDVVKTKKLSEDDARQMVKEEAAIMTKSQDDDKEIQSVVIDLLDGVEDDNENVNSDGNKENDSPVLRNSKNSFPDHKHRLQMPTRPTYPQRPITSSDCDHLGVYKRFLTNHTPTKIEEMLNERIVGQGELTKAAADFLYYHALRQVFPKLPVRPMLISGPSGSGKTEVWRAAKELFNYVFEIEIADGACITNEGWAGKNKVSSYMNERIINGGILIIDEFDKLAAPRYDSGGANVGADRQSELLKLLEGEYTIEPTKNKVARNDSIFTVDQIVPTESRLNTKKMGIVLVGAFESIKTKRQNKVGFGNVGDAESVETAITDEEYIDYGVLPELVGRIAMKVTTNQLSDGEYMQIIKNPYSRVSVISNVLNAFDIDVGEIVGENEIRELIKYSKTNKTGVRWVSAQVENRILESLRDKGVGDFFCPKRDESEKSDKKEDEFLF